jgi:hypothetical protein
MRAAKSPTLVAFVAWSGAANDGGAKAAGSGRLPASKITVGAP